MRVGGTLLRRRWSARCGQCRKKTAHGAESSDGVRLGAANLSGRKSVSEFDTACLMIQSLPVVSIHTVFFSGFIARRA